MNPETQSTRAKITQKSTDGLVQAIVDSPRGSQAWLNSGDVGLRRTSEAATARDHPDTQHDLIGRVHQSANSSGNPHAARSWAA
jgi:hypothetical protein